MFSKLLSRLRKKFGDTHPSTLTTMSNLALVYNNQGKHRDAEVLLKQCLDKMKLLLGESHHDTLGTMNNLAAASKLQAQVEGSLE